MTYTSITTTLGFGDVRLNAPRIDRLTKTTSTARLLTFPSSGSVTASNPPRIAEKCAPAGQGILPYLEPSQQPVAPALQQRLPSPVISLSLVAPPRLDPLLLAAVPAKVWLDPAVQSRLSSSVSAYVYVCGTYALQGLREILNATVYKAGTTARLSPQARIEELRLQQYGCMRVDDQGNWYGEPGYENWILVPPPREMRLSMGSCVTVLPEALGVRLPFHLNAAEFEARFTAKLQPFSIDHWASGEAVQRALISRHIDPRCAFRGTRVIENGTEFVRAAREFYALRPYRDFEALAAVAEEIVLDSLR